MLICHLADLLYFIVNLDVEVYTVRRLIVMPMAEVNYKSVRLGLLAVE